MSIAFTKFNTFIEALAEKVHKLDTDTLKVVLTNSAPTAGTDTVFDPVTKHPPPAAANGYTALGHTTAQTSSAQTAGAYKLCLTDVVITATAGGIGPFRYVILYNDTAANDELIGFYDYGVSITMTQAGEKLTVDFDADAGALTIAPV